MPICAHKQRPPRRPLPPDPREQEAEACHRAPGVVIPNLCVSCAGDPIPPTSTYYWHLLTDWMVDFLGCQDPTQRPCQCEVCVQAALGLLLWSQNPSKKILEHNSSCCTCYYKQHILMISWLIFCGSTMVQSVMLSCSHSAQWNWLWDPAPAALLAAFARANWADVWIWWKPRSCRTAAMMIPDGVGKWHIFIGTLY